MDEEKKKINIQNLKLYGGIHSKIILNKTFIVAPYLLYTLYGTSVVSAFLQEQTMFLDDLEYKAKVHQIINAQGEVYEEKAYLHPEAAKKVDEESIITVTYPWQETVSGYEREVIDYQFNSTDFITLNNLINDSAQIYDLKDQLEVIDSKSQSAIKISDSNNPSYEIKVTKMDENDFILQKENHEENEKAFLLSLMSIGAANFIGHIIFSKNFNQSRKKKIQTLKEQLIALKQEKNEKILTKKR